MPLTHPEKVPDPPELGSKTLWDYFPKRSLRRIVLLLLALAAVLILKRSGSWSLGGLLDGPRTPDEGAPTYHIKVTRPGDAPDRTPKSAP